MTQLIVNAFVEKRRLEQSSKFCMLVVNHEKVKAKYEELVAQHPDNYLAIYDVPLDTDLSTLDPKSTVDWERRIE